MTRKFSTFLFGTAATAGFAFFALFFAQRSAVAHNNDPGVRIELTFPPRSSEDTIYLTGNLRQAGGWNPAGIPIRMTSPTTGIIELDMNPGDTLEYKFTRGSWATVERSADYRDIGNRIFVGTSERKTVMIRVVAWADSLPPVAHSLSGDIRFHKEFRSEILDNSRMIAVYLPPGYDSSSGRYPVLYMHDGQNIFDAATSFIGVEWGVDEACEELIASGTIPPLIVVGIDNNAQRAYEYTTAMHETRGGGGGDSYARFVIDEVKPFIDRSYRTLPDREHTGVMGSSLGGIISLHMAWTRSDIFSRAGVVSAALWWADSEIIHRIARGPAPRQKPMFWIDMGTKEGVTHAGFLEGIANIRALGAALEKHGFREHEDFVLVEVEDADHSERAWKARIRDILIHLYGAQRNR